MSAAESYGELPEVLATVAEHAGLPAAAALARAVGGRRIYVPRPEQLTEDHELARALAGEGLDLSTARRLAVALGYGKVDVPFGPFVGEAQARRRRRKAVKRMLRAGELSRSEIAGRAGTTERTVYRIQAEDAAAPDLPLFPRE